MDDLELPLPEEEIQDVLSSVHHDLNNPLSIISGNAQFLRELSREKDLDDQFTSSVQDIQEAAQQMAEVLQRLNRLKEQLENGR